MRCSHFFKYCLKYCAAFSLLLLISFDSLAAEFNFAKSTTVGSWVKREDLSTDHKGKQTLAEMKLALVGSEKVDGVTHYWLEMAIQSYSLKKDKRKKNGPLSITKVLINAELFSASPANVLGNFSKYAKTIIVQQGDNDPMRIDQGGMLGESMMKGLGIEVEFKYSQGGSKKVDVPAGKFDCTVFNGEGTTETKVLIKKFKVVSKTEGCFSNSVPFGLVYSTTDSTINGNLNKSETRLVETGTGATSAITKEPVVAPAIPKLF
jgi:hypothetical protein